MGTLSVIRSGGGSFALERSREGCRDMELFFASVADLGRPERVAIAIKGRGAFRRFKDESARWPRRLGRWFALSEVRHAAEREHGSPQSAIVPCLAISPDPEMRIISAKADLT